MEVKSMSFCGENSYVAVDFKKDAPRQHRAVHWPSEPDSEVAYLLPSLALGIAAPPAGPDYGVTNNGVGEDGLFVVVKGIYPWGFTVCWLSSKTSFDVLEPIFALQNMEQEMYCDLGVEDWCFSSDGMHLAVVKNSEDGDQREDPFLVVFDLSEALEEINAQRLRRASGLPVLPSGPPKLPSNRILHPVDATWRPADSPRDSVRAREDVWRAAAAKAKESARRGQRRYAVINSLKRLRVELYSDGGGRSLGAAPAAAATATPQLVSEVAASTKVLEGELAFEIIHSDDLWRYILEFV